MPLTKATTNVVNLDKDTLINDLTVGKGGGDIATNTAIGLDALSSNTTGFNNAAVGRIALASNTTGNYNTAIGSASLNFNTTANNNTACGFTALYSNTTGGNNTANGFGALYSNTTGIANAAVGVNALFSNTTGGNNTANGFRALYSNTTGGNNTAVGRDALLNNTTFSNIGGFGFNAQVTGDNQLQLGDTATTVYAQAAVQTRSDERDKTDIRDTELGLDFVNALRPVDYKWDVREDYRPEAPEPVNKPIEPKEPTEPVKPEEIAEDASDEDKAKYEQDKAKYESDKARYEEDKVKYEEEKVKYAEELAAYNAYVVLKDKWLEDVKLANITHDGSKKRNRYHHGLIAQEVKAVLDAKGIDFGGFQDHKVKGGDDVLSIGYEELIAPMLKAIQELSAKVAELEAK